MILLRSATIDAYTGPYGVTTRQSFCGRAGASSSEIIANDVRPAYLWIVPEHLISGPDGSRLSVERASEGGVVRLTFQLSDSAPCVLHWGVASHQGGAWRAAAAEVWPDGSRAHGAAAVQSPFQPDSEGGRLVLRFPEDQTPPFVVFDLFSPATNRWENNRGRDFWVWLAEPPPEPSAVLKGSLGAALNELEVFALDLGGELAVAIQRNEQTVTLTLLTDVPSSVQLHWGCQERPRSRWTLPPADLRPKSTVEFDDTAVRTPFEPVDNLQRATLSFPLDAAPTGIGLVLFEEESGRWIKHRGADLFIRLGKEGSGAAPLSELMHRIVDGEMGPHGWTLMHRFNLCHDLIEDAGEDRDAWATLFVWLRYSAIRQLDWQRNYNTKPRELAHAQERLTARLAQSFIGHPSQRDLIRLMLGTVGRGGEGQRIRDDILHIMHRHHIKEVGGTWMEQWHQKLHNNTTPDDIVICEAYLAFLRGNGDLAAYDHALGVGGVTRERLAGFERPITGNPEWHPHLKDGLIHDFQNYLGLLKSVHSGTDLATAASAGGQLVDGGARDALNFVLAHFSEPRADVGDLTVRITVVRRQLTRLLAGEGDVNRVKAGLYLDLALEEALRTVIERQFHARADGPRLVGLIELVLENLLLRGEDAELAQCSRELARLPNENRFSPDWSLRAKAVVDRLRRAVESATDQTYRLLQPKAEVLGREFNADQWTVQLFSEEIVRGRPLFVLSVLLHHLDPLLRRGAKLGDWQVISPSRAAGVVKVVGSLRAVQGRPFALPTVLVADEVHGDEEPPEGVCAVLTPKSVDLVSHVAVRARNASLLFATCFDSATFAKLKGLDGKSVRLAVTSSGDVKVEEGDSPAGSTARRKRAASVKINPPKPSLLVLRRNQFVHGSVGSKSWHIRELAEKLPSAFLTPRSVALPFGVFDAVLEEPANAAAARQIEGLRSEVRQAPEAKLAELRECILGLQLPDRLLSDLFAAMQAEGLKVGQASSLSSDSLTGCGSEQATQLERAVDAGGQPTGVAGRDSTLETTESMMTGETPVPRQTVAQRIKQVWASLWNDRAYFSREATGFPHESVSMAVLIQEVVPADYAFVIHTVNPATGNKGELYAEVVQGLGETLVGNYPGRALSLVADKATLKPVVTAYPSKSVALRGGGLIFRSDSNAEDLEGYAGAGLYDSVLLEPAHEERVDTVNDPLVWDAAFQSKLLRGIAELGIAVEVAFGGPQDIEGAWAEGKFHVVQTRPQVG